MEPELSPEATPDEIEKTSEAVPSMADQLQALTLSVSTLADRTEAMADQLEQLTAASVSAAALEAAEAVEEQREELQELATPASTPTVVVGAATSAIDPETLAPNQVPPMGTMPEPVTSKRKRRGLFRQRGSVTA